MGWLWVLLALAGVGVLVAWALNTPCTMVVRALVDALGPVLFVHLYLVDHLILIRFRLPSQKRRKKRKNRRDAKDLRREVRKQIRRTRLLSKLDIRARLFVRLGTGDAARTALLCGAVRALMEMLYGPIGAQAKQASFDCEMIPDFRKTVFYLDFFCMITAKTGNIIAVAVLLPLKLLGGKIRHER